MYKGVWLAKTATHKRIIILGESHYEDAKSQGGTASYKTMDVIDAYLSGKEKIKFFSSIAQSFGYYDESIMNFYDMVCFGNYVDELCGVCAWNHASDYVSQNRLKYNEELFQFCNNQSIDIVICFTILCYDALPKRELGEMPQEKIYIGEIAGKPNYIRKYTYFPGERKDCKTNLSKNLVVYGIKHPSSQSGYIPKQVYDFMRAESEVSWLCK